MLVSGLKPSKRLNIAGSTGTSRPLVGIASDGTSIRNPVGVDASSIRYRLEGHGSRQWFGFRFSHSGRESSGPASASSSPHAAPTRDTHARRRIMIRARGPTEESLL